jgi:hypothetical protein
MTLSRAGALRLAEQAIREGALALRGRLVRGENGQLKVDDRSVTGWLGQYEGREVIILLAPMEANGPERSRQCAVCGRDYDGPECPHCSSARARLRGRS